MTEKMITYRKAILSDAEKLAEIRSIFLREINNEKYGSKDVHGDMDYFIW